MRVLSLISQKGGAGKSTLSLHLAVEASRRGQRAYVVDLDPQGNASRWGNRRPAGPAGDAVVVPLSAAGLDNFIATRRLSGADLIVLDTAPAADHTAMKAARAADLILVPCRPSQFDLEAIGQTLDMAELAKRPAMVVLNAAPARARSSVVFAARQAIHAAGTTVCATTIYDRVAYRHCMNAGLVAAEHEPHGKAADDIGLLFDEVSSFLRADTATRSSVGVSA